LRRARRPVATCLCLRPTSWTELLWSYVRLRMRTRRR